MSVWKTGKERWEGCARLPSCRSKSANTHGRASPLQLQALQASAWMLHTAGREGAGAWDEMGWDVGPAVLELMGGRPSTVTQPAWLDVPFPVSSQEVATLFKKRHVLFLPQRPPGLGSPPYRVSWTQENSTKGPLVGDSNKKVG